MSALYVVGCWIFGLAWIGLLSALAGAEQPWVARLARGIFAAGIAVILVVAVVIVAAANTAAKPQDGPSHSGVWAYAVGSAIPVTILGLVTMRRVFARPLITSAATLPAAAFLVGSALAFRPTGAKLDGLAATAHDHHALVVATLLAVIVLPTATFVYPRAVRPDTSKRE